MNRKSRNHCRRLGRVGLISVAFVCFISVIAIHLFFTYRGCIAAISHGKPVSATEQPLGFTREYTVLKGEWIVATVDDHGKRHSEVFGPGERFRGTPHLSCNSKEDAINAVLQNARIFGSGKSAEKP